MKLKRILFSAVAATCLGSAPSHAAVIDLGFALDSSGSIGSSNWTLIKSGLASALAQIPTSGPDQYRITVVNFSSTAATVVNPTILTAGNLAAVQALINGAAFLNSTTCISCAVTLIDSLVTAAAGGLGLGLINITTDGEPNVGVTNGTTLRNTLTGSGWDSISAEAIGSFDLTFLGNLVYPNPGVTTGNPSNLPNPLTQGFILTVDNASDYGGAIGAKIQRIVQTPEPGTLALFGLGLLGLGAARRRKA